jgi:hypothetical protein
VNLNRKFVSALTIETASFFCFPSTPLRITAKKDTVESVLKCPNFKETKNLSRLINHRENTNEPIQLMNYFQLITKYAE